MMRIHLILLAMLFVLFAATTVYTITCFAEGIDDLIGSEQNETQNQTTDITHRFNLFEGRVIILSYSNRTKDTVLAAKPNGKIYPHYEILIFTNQPAYYLVRVDNQTYQEGSMEWFALVKGYTPYQTIDIEVIIENETGIRLPPFKFNNIKVLQEEAEETPETIKPYVKLFTEGEVTWMLVKRVISDTLLALWAFLTGSGVAVIHADLRGVERIF